MLLPIFFRSSFSSTLARARCSRTSVWKPSISRLSASRACGVASGERSEKAMRQATSEIPRLEGGRGGCRPGSDRRSLQPGVLDGGRELRLRLGLEGPDEVADEKEARSVLRGPLRLAVDEVARVRKEELGQLLAGLLEDEGVEPFAFHRPDPADELDGQLALAPLALQVEDQLPGPSGRHREPPFCMQRVCEGQGRQARR